MRRGFASTQPQRWRAGCREVFGRVPKRSGGSGSAVKAQTAPPTLRSKPVLMGQMEMSLRQPQASLRVRRGRLVSLFTPLGRLNAGECRRGGPRVILQASFTRMQRPFLCHKRAVAVERNTDARDRESQKGAASEGMLSA